jgi:hypothetical protein
MKKFLSIILTTILGIQSGLIAMDQDNQAEINNTQEQKKETEIDPEVAYQIGMEYLDNDELEEAFKNIDYAARKNHFEAQIELTHMLYEGIGCKINLVGALNICQLVKESSDKLADEAYQVYDDEKENYYNDVYWEFVKLWGKIATKVLTQDMKMANLISVLDLSGKKDLTEKPMSEEVRRMYI